MPIRAIKYFPGMEDGFHTRYTSKEEMDLYRSGKIDSVSTWGIPSIDQSEEDIVRIKVPYVLVGGREILLGDGWYLVEDGDRVFGMMEGEFLEKYEEVVWVN